MRHTMRHNARPRRRWLQATAMTVAMSRATLAALAAALAGLAIAVAAGADADAGLGVGAGGIALAADGAVRPAEVPAPDAGVAAEAFAVADHVVALRRELHRVPAVVYEEHNASAIVRRELDALGVRYTFPVAITGVVAEVGEGEPIVLLRADLDGLPVHEEADVPFASAYPGRMHACGHDAHAAMLLGAAKVRMCAAPRVCAGPCVRQHARAAACAHAHTRTHACIHAHTRIHARARAGPQGAGRRGPAAERHRAAGVAAR